MCVCKLGRYVKGVGGLGIACPRSHPHELKREVRRFDTVPSKREENHYKLGYKVGPRLRELAPRGQREPGGGIHATS